jgi:hypothetical protein
LFEPHADQHRCNADCNNLHIVSLLNSERVFHASRPRHCEHACRRVVGQSDPIQCAAAVTSESMVHLNPATLVTPTV